MRVQPMKRRSPKGSGTCATNEWFADEPLPPVEGDEAPTPAFEEAVPAPAFSLVCSASPSELDSLGPDSSSPVFGLMRY